MDDIDNGKVNRVLIQQLTMELRKLEVELEKTRESLAETREQMASIKTEIRIFGGLILLALGAVITLVINHLVT